ALEVRATRGLSECELLSGVALGVGQTAAPPGARVENVQRVETELGVVRVSDFESELRQPLGLTYVGAAVQRNLGQSSERPSLAAAFPLGRSLVSNRFHLPGHGRHVAQPEGGAGSLITTLQRRLELQRVQKLLAC